MDENEYNIQRNEILAIPTAAEHVRAARAAQLDYDNQSELSHDPVISLQHKLAQEKKKRQHSIIVHCTYEGRFCHYQSELHHIWQNNFHKTPIMFSKLIVGTRNTNNLTRELVRRAPYRRQTTTHRSDKQKRTPRIRRKIKNMAQQRQKRYHFKYL